MEDIKLFHDKKEQQFQEDCADLFAMLKATESLERAYIRDWVKANDYEIACEKLISQFKAHFTGSFKEEVGSIEVFAGKFNINVAKAIQRLVYVGMPATREHLMPMANVSGNSHTAVMDATSAIITAIDTIKVQMSAVDQILPYLMAVLDAFRALRLLPTFEGFTKIKEWVAALNGKPAHFELSEDDKRQLAFDLENCYKQFEDQIKSGI